MSKVETALFKIKKTHETLGQKSNEALIPMEMKQTDFVCLAKYLFIRVRLIDYLKTKSKPIDKATLKKVTPYIPHFILNGIESASDLEMRVTSAGLTMS